uniref:Uncharacterized protein n=1 Tax=Oryza glumipatula TaxID=40148 RepID=A0A0D9YJW1_9ORYZ
MGARRGWRAHRAWNDHFPFPTDLHILGSNSAAGDKTGCSTAATDAPPMLLRGGGPAAPAIPRSRLVSYRLHPRHVEEMQRQRQAGR